jgi:hypothetical protein
MDLFIATGVVTRQEPFAVEGRSVSAIDAVDPTSAAITVPLKLAYSTKNQLLLYCNPLNNQGKKIKRKIKKFKKCKKNQNIIK